MGNRKEKPVRMAVNLTFKALISMGFSIRKASTILGISPTTGMRILKRLRVQGEETSTFLSVARDEKLGKLVDHYLDKGIKLRNIKGSDALGAAKLYADRRYPAREAPRPESYSFVQINIDEARIHPAPVLSIELEPIVQVLDVDPDPGPDEEPPEETP